MAQKTKPSPLARAISEAGGQSALARKIGRNQQSIWQWLHKRDGLVPAEAAVAIEAAEVGVTKNELRPDVFGELEAAQ